MTYLKKFRLNNKKAYILGGSGTIGFEICNALNDFGAKVINLDKKFNSKLKKNIKQIKFDFSNLSKIEKKLNQIFKKEGLPDIFVNCSYAFTKDWQRSSFKEVNINSIKKNVDLQLSSNIWISKIVAEKMRKNRIKGNIILLSSIYGVVAQDSEVYKNTKIKVNSIYSAVKGALINHTKQLASYYGQFSIRVNIISPGGIKGKIAGKRNKQSSKFIKNYSKKTALKRMALPSDIAPAVIYLVSDAGSYVTGFNLIIDGGWTIT
tara:strand:- start:175 stop:963 length:789 start_codon:yes stop_codon:yes gene_type:complete